MEKMLREEVESIENYRKKYIANRSFGKEEFLKNYIFDLKKYIENQEVIINSFHDRINIVENDNNFLLEKVNILLLIIKEIENRSNGEMEK